MSKRISLMFILFLLLGLMPQPSRAQEGTCVVDLVVALDGDTAVRSWAADLLAGLPVSEDQLQATVIQGDEPSFLIEASGDAAALTEAINAATTPEEETNLYDLLKMALTPSARADVPKVLLLITDGYIEGTVAQDLSATLREEMQILIVAVGDLKVNELVSIAGLDYNVVQVANTSDLAVLNSMLQSAVCAGGQIFTCTVHSILVEERVNMRVAPGMDQVWVDFMPNGIEFNVIAQAKDWENVTWWQLENSYWVRHDIVGETGDCSLVPVVNP